MNQNESRAPTNGQIGGERKPRFFGYTRASTYKQVISPEDQEKRLVKHYKTVVGQREAEWGGVFADKATTSGIPLAERPNGRLLIESLQPGDGVGITDVDRMFRDWQEAVQWVEHWRKKQQIVLHVICQGIDTSTPLGAFFVGTLAYFGETERIWNRERTRRAMEHSIIRGKVSEADLLSITDYNANFPSRLAGRCVIIRSGTGAGQRRQIETVTEQTIRIVEPWNVVPNATSAYRILKRPDSPLNQKAPLGFRLVGPPGNRRVVEDEQERQVMAQIVQKREVERLTFEQIYWLFHADGCRTRDGRKWSVSRIQRAYHAAKKRPV